MDRLHSWCYFLEGLTPSLAGRIAIRHMLKELRYRIAFKRDRVILRSFGCVCPTLARAVANGGHRLSGRAREAEALANSRP